MEKLNEIDGKVTMLGTNLLTQTNERSGQSFTVMVDSNTVYEDFDRSGCTASPAEFTCVQAGQILDVELSENGTGTLLAKRVELGRMRTIRLSRALSPAWTARRSLRWLCSMKSLP